MVGLGSEVFIFMYVPLNFPFVWLIDNWGIRFSITSGALLTFAGVWIRMIALIKYSFYWMLAGQTVGAIAGPLLINSSATLAVTWFKPK